MSYVAPYIDSTGLHLPTYQDILDDMIATMKTIYGDDIYLEEDSADYQMLSIFALKQYDTLQTLAYAYNSRSPETAVGVALDSVVKLNGINRKSAGYSTCVVKLWGTAFTVISNGIVKDASGTEWALPSQAVIGSNGTLTTTVTCTTAGAITALVGDITKIVTPTYGWVGVTNEVAAVIGNASETDAELRIRQAISTAIPSQTMLDGTRGAIASINNIKRFICYENDTNLSTVDADKNPNGFPAHSVTCVVEGGTDADIASAILYHKGIGVATNGDLAIDVTDASGYVNSIKFFRPVYVNVFVTIKIEKYSSYVTSMNDVIKKAVAAYITNQQIGRKLSNGIIGGIASNCNSDLTNPSFSVISTKLGTEFGFEKSSDLALDFKSLPICTVDNISVEVA